MSGTSLASLVMLSLLIGCANTSRTYGPTGKVAHTLNCSGLARSWGACFAAAGEICGTWGYDIVSAQTDNGTIVSATPQQLMGGSTFSRSMLIECKGQ